jgi:putative RecB family exonuclease
MSLTEPVQTGPVLDQPMPQLEVLQYLSPSSASTFRQCPQRWKYRYVDRLADPKGIPAIVGTFVHRVLEDLMVLEQGERTIEVAQKIAGRLWPEVSSDGDFRALELDDRDERGVRWKSWGLIEDYFAMEDPTSVEVAEREQRLEVTLEGVPFVGVVDRTEHTAEGLLITDYKTGRAPAARYEAGRLDQVWLYAAALGAAGQDVSRVRLMYLGSRNIEKPIDAEAVAGAVGQHRTTWDDIGVAIDAEMFPVKPGPLCNWCPYSAQCPQGQLEIERRYGRSA